MLQPLSGDSTPNEEHGEAADPTEVATKSFATSLRGYDQEEVRTYLRHVASALRDAQRREADIRSRLGKAVRRAEEASAKAGVLPDDELTSRLGSEVSRVIESARVAAEERTARSVAEAEALVARARTEAETIRTEAEALLAERSEEAEAEADKILTAAEADRAAREREGDELFNKAQEIARQHLVEAQREGESIVEQAEVARRQILKEMDRRRRQMRMQVEQLKAARDRLLASHGEMTRTLDEMAVELRQSVLEAKTKGDSAVRRISESRFSTHDEIEAEIADAAMIGRLDLPPIELRDELDIDAVVGPRLEDDDHDEAATIVSIDGQIRLPHNDAHRSAKADVSPGDVVEADGDRGRFDGPGLAGPALDGPAPDEDVLAGATPEEDTLSGPALDEDEFEGPEGDVHSNVDVEGDFVDDLEIDDLVPDEGVLDTDDGFFIATITGEHRVISVLHRDDDDLDDADDDFDLGDDDLLAEVSPLFPEEADDSLDPDVDSDGSDEADEASGSDLADENEVSLEIVENDDLELVESDDLETVESDDLEIVESDDPESEGIVLDEAEAESGAVLQPEHIFSDEEADTILEEEEVAAKIEAVLAELPTMADGSSRAMNAHPSQARAAHPAQDRNVFAPQPVPDLVDRYDAVIDESLDATQTPESDDSLATIFARIRVRATETQPVEGDGANAAVALMADESSSDEPPVPDGARARADSAAVATDSAKVDTRPTDVVPTEARATDPNHNGRRDNDDLIAEELGDDDLIAEELGDDDLIAEELGDDDLIAMRDDATRDLIDQIGRRLKRVLMDEQNVVFEAAEREYGGPLIEIMPDKEHHVDLYLDAVFLQLQATYGAGAAFVDPDAKVRKLPRSFFEETLAELVVIPLREALSQAIPVDAGEETSQALRRFYRSHKNTVIAVAAEQLAALAFSKGITAAVGHGALVRWVYVAGDDGCADGVLNAASEPLSLGEEFPSGHLTPPIAAGCRCLLVPADR